MKGLAAIIVVLQESGTPLHYKEITKKLLEQKLLHPKGKTPEATVNSYLTKEIKTRGVSSKIQRTAEGIYALREWGLQEYFGKKGIPN